MRHITKRTKYNTKKKTKGRVEKRKQMEFSNFKTQSKNFNRIDNYQVVHPLYS